MRKARNGKRLLGIGPKPTAHQQTGEPTMSEAKVIESGVSWSYNHPEATVKSVKHPSPALVEVSSEGHMLITVGGEAVQLVLRFAPPATRLLRSLLGDGSDIPEKEPSSAWYHPQNNNGCICKFHKQKDCPQHKDDPEVT